MARIDIGKDCPQQPGEPGWPAGLLFLWYDPAMQGKRQYGKAADARATKEDPMRKLTAQAIHDEFGGCISLPVGHPPPQAGTHAA